MGWWRGTRGPAVHGEPAGGGRRGLAEAGQDRGRVGHFKQSKENPGLVPWTHRQLKWHKWNWWKPHSLGKPKILKQGQIFTHTKKGHWNVVNNLLPPLFWENISRDYNKELQYWPLRGFSLLTALLAHNYGFSKVPSYNFLHIIPVISPQMECLQTKLSVFTPLLNIPKVFPATP